MKKKTQIIISISGIIIILLSLLGLTYGYYLSNIQGNSATTSISVETGIPGVLYTDLTTEDYEDITIKPGFTMTKRFKVESTGNTKATYSIFLVDVFNNFVRTEDVTYKLYRIGNSENFPDNYTGCIENPTDEMACKVVVSSAEFPTQTSLVKGNEVLTTPGDYYIYEMVITYINHPTINQNADQGHTFSGTINLRPTDSDQNPFAEGTLAYNIYDNGAQLLDTTNDELYYDKTYAIKTTATKVSDGTDREDMGIFTAPDDYGTSYYFRGPVKNNYVDFAGFTWRIVRINGDGSIRLILNEGISRQVINNSNVKDNSKLSSIDSDGYVNFPNGYGSSNTFVGYMHGVDWYMMSDALIDVCVILQNGIATDVYTDEYATKELCESNGGTWANNTYDAVHMNVESSRVKKYVDAFYEEYLVGYQNYISDALFCGDKTLAHEEVGSNNSATGYGLNVSYYAASERLLYSTGTTAITTATPTLECAKGATNTYSRYTSKLDTNTTTTKGVSVNNDLEYPIALITADEIALAGAKMYDVTNQNFYLANNNISFWTMTPFFYDSSSYVFSYGYYSATSYEFAAAAQNDVRPVINLKSNLIVSGNGTSGDPYTIRETS